MKVKFFYAILFLTFFHEAKSDKEIRYSTTKNEIFLRNKFESSSAESSFKSSVSSLKESEDNDGLISLFPKTKFYIVVNNDEELDDILHTGTLQLIIFLYLGDQKLKKQLNYKQFNDFLNNYDEAAGILRGYSIYLGMVNCSSKVSTEFCSPEKAGNLAHGFQRQQEKIGFPLETLYSVDSIIASTLHLLLLNSVPIIQSLAERKGLEGKCRYKCDIILAHHKSLGTKEHRLFLEISDRFKNKFRFSLTTYSSAIYGLPNAPSPEEAQEINPLIFVLHCSNGHPYTTPKDKKYFLKETKEDDSLAANEIDPCSVVSYYDGIFQNQEFTDFLNVLQRPLWEDIAPDVLALNANLSSVLLNESQRHQVVFVYDLENKERVLATVPTIAKVLVASVKLFTINRKYLAEEFQNVLKINLNEIRTPTVLFLPNNQIGETTLLNDYDDALSWIKGEIKSHKLDRRKDENREENLAIHQLYEIEELQEDDEVASEMVNEDAFTLVPPIEGEEQFNQLIASRRTETLAIAFYLSWDPVSNVLLQHLQEVGRRAKEVEQRVSTYRVNCFDWPELCDRMEVHTFPVLKLWSPNGISITYNGPIDATRLRLTLLLLECESNPLVLNGSEMVFPITSINQSNSCSVFNEVSSFTTGIFSSKKDADAFVSVSKRLFGYHLLGLVVDKEAVTDVCLNANGCVVITKKDDLFQPQFKINSFLNDSTALSKLIEYHVENVFGPLSPSNSAVMNFEDDCQSQGNILVVLMLSSCHLKTQAQSRTDFVRENDFEIVRKARMGSTNESCANPFSRDAKKWLPKRELPREKKQTNCERILSEADSSSFRLVGHVAEQLSSPGLVFSYICSKDELGVEVLNSYNLPQNRSHLVAVKKSVGHVFVFGHESLQDGYAIQRWVKFILTGKAAPNLLLQSEEWGPVLEDFDYMSYMEEDMFREAEEQLALDMEIDIGSYNTRGTTPHIRKRN